MTEKIRGELEIDHERGVLYFHASSPRVAERYNAVTILRVCRVKRRIIYNQPIDLTGGYDVER